MTTLKRGDYCCPSTEAEWKSILDLAEALGIRLPVIYNGDWDTCPFIWYSDTVLNDEGVCQLSKRSGSRNDPKINVPDFIAGMYAMKEAKENKPKNALNDGVMVVGTKSSYDDRLRSLEVKSLLFDDILKRLTTLEGNIIAPSAIRDLVRMSETQDRLTTIEDTIQSHKLGLEQHFDRLKVLGSLIKNLEERQPIDMRECENVSQDDVDATRLSLCKRQYVNMTDHVDFVIQFDPKASPKNIPFSVALEYLKAGREVRRAQWRDGAFRYDYANKWITGSPLLMVADTDMIAIPVRDIIATDWEVIPETKKP